MKTLLLVFIIMAYNCFGQEHGFPFGRTSINEIEMKVYAKDTSASAIVLEEFGEAYIENGNNYNLLFEYHVRIKILNQHGLDRANIEIPLFKSEGRKEVINSITASSFTKQGNTIKETKSKQFFIENRNKYWDLQKVTIPNVQVGSIIEIKYALESPFIFKFRPWEFQSDIPKIKSEYWASIPGNYTYNMTMRGALKLSKNQTEIIKDCFTAGTGKSDCARYMYAMVDVPAFIEEDYMTSKSNFISAINFELSEVKYFDGRIDKFTKEWKDVEEELKRNENFGLQLKKGREVVDKTVDLTQKDSLGKAQQIYNFIREWYTWDGENAKYSETGIKKAFEKKTGNSADINLSLLAALKYAGLSADPVILSTRANGLPIDLHPVLSDFNYVIAKLTIAGQNYLLDATDKYLPFGSIPMYCINGKGRVIEEKGSSWVELSPLEKSKKKTKLLLKIDSDGKLKGTIEIEYSGYDALQKRKEVDGFATVGEYAEDRKTKWDAINTKNYEVLEVINLDRPLIEKFEIESTVLDDPTVSNFLFNPFIMDRKKTNPFKSDARSYPIDFESAFEATTYLELEYPSHFDVGIPERAGIVLPRSGGRYSFNIQNTEHVIKMTSSLNIFRQVFPSVDYKPLKDLYSKIIQVENTDLVFTKQN